MSEFGSKIRHLREARKLSQVQLAKFIGVSPGSVANWEAGIRKNPRGQTLLKLADALGVEPSELIASNVRATEISDNHEIRLLAVFRSLTEDQKHLAIRLIEAVNK